MSSIEPTAEQVARLVQTPDNGPVVMINLLAFKAPDGARSYQRYADEVQPCLERIGAKVLYYGVAQTLVVGEGEQPWWDVTVVVEYPSVSAFLAMTGTPEYQAIHIYRAQALERAELIATTPGALEL